MNTNALRSYKAGLHLTTRQQQLLDGLLLGDGHLERQQGALFARLRIEHSAKQAAYVAWKYREWRAWVRTPPACRLKSNRLGTTSVNLAFTTLSHPELEAFRERFYQGRRKTVPRDLSLSALSMAVWFMDDGSRKSSQCRGVYLNTQGFSPCEIERLQEFILRDAELNTTVRQQHDGWQIYVPSSSVPTLTSYIGNHLLPCMRYKLPG